MWELSRDSPTYCAPRQVAADTEARLVHGMTGWSPGPIRIDGDRQDAKTTRDAV